MGQRTVGFFLLPKKKMSAWGAKTPNWSAMSVMSGGVASCPMVEMRVHIKE